MADTTYRMDGHKLYWHLDRVNDWMSGKRIPPLHIDVGLSKGCNIKCHYCFGVVQGNRYEQGKEVFFPREPLLRYVSEAGEMGVRSMAMIGEAEPLLNPHVYEAIVAGKRAGVDMALGTNGVLFDTSRQGEEALEHLTWLRFNISAASAGSYQRLHNSPDFDLLVEKIRFCIARKKALNSAVTIGFQMVLTPQDIDEVMPLTSLAKELGVDYLEIKHCGDTVQNDLGIFNKLDQYDQFRDILLQAEEHSTDTFKVVIKWGNINRKGKRSYNRCLGAPFLLYSSGDGKLYPCGMFFSYREPEFCLGDLTRQSFKAIIESDAYWQTMKRIETEIKVHEECYASCKTNAINEFLYTLKNPPQHINFI
ncbi:radical SAM domain iron-sulfur cluster-binding oxidoreductase [Geotalea daltonii FRC-32]|uniref:Radical SAM domain iron-sulfur cluster-binding oxidoreductase n=1 Tax=Geotalea daltonii (strain DSM 22248 / JCM 15807 / FRC-32) TaxID=316067 RepID=B9M0J0_GEODF|nr:radical SAM protein [Geotalea daltonii]ACM19027.1 radical SAM domain iron-sulfur cluster-binding oxidoreductase [Geotalea daltonii FRC-32]